MEEENEYIELPDDPEEAFAALQRRKYKSLEQAWEDNRNGSWHLERQYVDTLLAFDEVHSLGILTEFQSWKLNVNADRTATLTCEDGNGGVVFTKAIEYTDFPLAEITLYFMNKTILLPSEY